MGRINISIVALFATALVVVLAGCATTPPNPPDASIDFSTEGAIFVPASSVTMVDAYVPSLREPNIEHDHTKRPAHIVGQWLDQRVQADSNAAASFTVKITEASVVEETLATQSGWKGLLKREPERRITGTLAWEVIYESPALTWTTAATAESVRTLPEQSSLNEADGAYADLLEALAKNFDKRSEEQIQNLRKAIAATQ